MTPPYDEVQLVTYGTSEFQDFVCYLSSLQVCSHLNFHAALASRIHDRIKNAIVSVVWGDNFYSIGASLFEISDGEFKGKFLKEILEPTDSISEFSLFEGTEFSLSTQFVIRCKDLDNALKVTFNEPALWEAFYIKPELVKLLGREAGFALDRAYNMGGSEAIAESFFATMRNQHKKNHSMETADMRTLVKTCLPEPSKCPETIEEIFEIFVNGDNSKAVRKHRSNIFVDQKQRSLHKYKVSKAIDSLITMQKKTGCNYFS